jgi:hypothetical protein
MLPNKANDEPEEDEDEVVEKTSQNNWEMQNMATPTATGAVPYTPRTMAFRTLDRQPVGTKARFG